MKLYVCYGTFTLGRPICRHPCGEAHEALTQVGYDPEVVRVCGLGPLPDFVNALTRRREVRELTGQYLVPALVLDDGTVIRDSRAIIAWARTHPAPVRSA